MSGASGTLLPPAAQPAAFPLLDLPTPCLLAVFGELKDLSDAVALSRCCKELWALGSEARRRHVCCAACGHAVLQPARAFGSETHRQAPQVELPDGDAYAVDAEHCTPGCRLSAKELALQAYPTLLSLRADVGLRKAGDPSYEVRVQQVLCGGCGLHLGLRFVQLGKLRAGQAEGCIRFWRELQVLGACFLARRYLRLRAADDGREEHLGRQPPAAAGTLYACTAARSSLRPPGGCGAVLFEGRDILSRRHCWDTGGGPEAALFINAFRSGAVQARNERQERLCQGTMRVADVHCATCGARIGWRFCADLTAEEKNCNQVGRYGVVRSSIQRVTAGAPAAPATPGSPASTEGDSDA